MSYSTKVRYSVYCLLISLLLFPAISFATPYTWGRTNASHLWEDDYNGSLADYGTYRTEDFVFNPSENDDWEFLGAQEAGDLCVGIIRFKTKAWGNPRNQFPSPYFSYPTEGWAYGYFATPNSGIGNCETILDPASYDVPNNNGGNGDNAPRPGVIFLHGNGDRGSIAWASLWANLIAFNNPPVFVLSISAPGQGIDCHIRYWIHANAPEECIIWQDYQYSHGDTVLDSDYLRGFTGYSQYPNPDQNLAWAYSMSAMRAISLFKSVFDGKPNESFQVTDGKLVLGGLSLGGMVALGINGVDSDSNGDPRLDGMFLVAATGGIDQNMSIAGNWATLQNAERQGIVPSPDESLDCDAVSANPTSYNLWKRKSCELIDYFEPTNSTQNVPLFITLGSQDEIFTYFGFIETLQHLDSIQDGPEFSFYYLADMDHGYYFSWNAAKEATMVANYGEQVEAFANIRIVRAFNSAAKYAQTIFGSLQSYPTRPNTPDEITENIEEGTLEDTDKYVYEIAVDAASTDNIYINITIDDFYLILPACSDVNWNSTTATYTIDMSSPQGQRYSFFNECRDGALDHYMKCDQYSDVDTSDIGKAKFISPRWKAFLVFDNVDDDNRDELPNTITAWAENRVEPLFQIPYAISGKPRTWYKQGITSFEPCVRYKEGSPTKELIQYYPGLEDYYDEDIPTPLFDNDETCEDWIINSNYTINGGDKLEFDNKNIIIPSGSSLSVNGDTLVIYTSCDVVVQTGGALHADSNEAGTVEIYARNIQVQSGASVTATGAQGGNILLVAKEDVGISGTLNVNSTATDGSFVKILSGGNLYVAGEIDANGDERGGTIETHVGQNTTIASNGKLYATATDNEGLGGKIELSTDIKLTVSSGGIIDASSYQNGAINLTYCTYSIDDEYIDPNPNLNPYCPYEIIDAGQQQNYVITSATEWDEGPYLIDDNVYVCGTTLTIDPGVQIYFMPGKSLYIGDPYSQCGTSTLDADGTGGDPIVFTSIEGNPQPGDWGGIGFMANSANNVLNNAIIRYAGDSAVGMAVLVRNDSTNIEDVEIGYSDSLGIYFYDAEVDVTDLWVHTCADSGIKVSDVPSGSTLTGAFVENCPVGIELQNGSDLDIISSIIYDNWEIGIDNYASTFYMDESEISYNSSLGTIISSNTFASGIIIRYGSLTGIVISNNNVILGNRPGNPDIDYEYELMNLSIYNMNATYNYWGTDQSSDIAAWVYDDADYAPLGVVDYSNFLTSAP